MKRILSKISFALFSILLSLTFMVCPDLNETADEISTGKLLVINTNGRSDGDIESFGQLPESISISRDFQSSRNTSSIKPIIKDRNTSNFVINKKVSQVPRKKLTKNISTNNFIVQKEDKKFTTIAATLRYGTDDSKCLIYVENGKESDHNWSLVGEKFDTDVYSKSVEIFGEHTDVDENEKIVIFYYAMEGDTVGYFYPFDLYEDPNSNHMEIFYMNIAWGEPNDPEMVRTLAHEFQHMINYGNRVMLNNKEPMDAWLDEALAESAEHAVMNSPGQGRISTFNNNNKSSISNGFPLCIWGDGEQENYSLVYLFMQYCRIQSVDGVGIYKKLINHEYEDYRAIEDIMKSQNSNFPDFATLSTSYRLANLLQLESGIYSYGNESSTFKLSSYPYTSSSVEGLKPGGSLYIDLSQENLNSFTPKNSGTNIKYYKIIDNVVTEIDTL